MVRRAALFLLGLFVAAGAAAQQQPAPATQAKKAAKPAAAKPAQRLAWAELTADQQMILAPLKDSWGQIEPERRRKWMGIAKRYPTMKPQEQERVQRRMQRWAALTPQQRMQARENYKRIAKQRAEKKQKLAERWAEYQALPPDQRDLHAPPP